MLNGILISLFAIFFLIIAWQKIVGALFIIIVLLPSYLVRFQIGWIPVTLLELMILILFVVWLVKLLVKKERIKFPLKWLILLLVLAAILSVFISPDSRAGLGLLKAYFIEPILLFIFRFCP